MLGPSALNGAAHVVHLALTPIFLLAGIASLLSVFTIRLGRVADRVDKLTETGVEHPQQLARLRLRSRALDAAVLLATFLQGPGTSEGDIARLNRAIEQDQPINVDLLSYRRDGTPFWNRLRTLPLPRRDAHTRLFVAWLRDVTAERDPGAEELVERHLRYLEAAQASEELADVARRLQLSQVADDFGSGPGILPRTSSRRPTDASCCLVSRRRIN